MTPATSKPWNVLVVGYGSDLRGDDGVGPWVAGQIEALRLPGVRVLTPHQLLPELAEDMAQANRVIFIDAAASASGLRVESVRPTTRSAESLVHVVRPEQLLGLCRLLYDCEPASFVVAVPAFAFSGPAMLTAAAHAFAQQAVATVRALCNDAPHR